MVATLRDLYAHMQWKQFDVTVIGDLDAVLDCHGQWHVDPACDDLATPNSPTPFPATNLLDPTFPLCVTCDGVFGTAAVDTPAFQYGEAITRGVMMRAVNSTAGFVSPTDPGVGPADIVRSLVLLTVARARLNRLAAGPVRSRDGVTLPQPAEAAAQAAITGALALCDLLEPLYRATLHAGSSTWPWDTARVFGTEVIDPPGPAGDPADPTSVAALFARWRTSRQNHHNADGSLAEQWSVGHPQSRGAALALLNAWDLQVSEVMFPDPEPNPAPPLRLLAHLDITHDEAPEPGVMEHRLLPNLALAAYPVDVDSVDGVALQAVPWQVMQAVTGSRHCHDLGPVDTFGPVSAEAWRLVLAERDLSVNAPPSPPMSDPGSLRQQLLATQAALAGRQQP